MSAEEKARKMGWVPKEEFKGNEEQWVDADTFLERGENIMPILKERYKALEDKFDSLTKESSAKIDKLNRSLEKLAEFNKKTHEAAYKKAKRELEAEMRSAVELGDVQKYDEVNRKIGELNQEVQQTVQNQPKEHPDYEGWVRENPWYLKDKDLAAYANGVAPEIGQANPNLNGRAFYEKITERVKAMFPEKFENPRKGDPPAVEGGSAPSGGSKKGKGWGDLPQEAKQAYMMEFSEIKGFSKEDYAKSYWEQEGV